MPRKRRLPRRGILRDFSIVGDADLAVKVVLAKSRFI